MKIGILGTGDVGRALGNGFIALGHEVKMGSRDAHNEKAVAWASTSGINASTGTFAEAVKFGDVIVLALLWAGTENALKLAGVENFAGKVVIDAINPLVFTPKRACARARAYRFRGRASAAMAAFGAHCEGIQYCRLCAYVQA